MRGVAEQGIDIIDQLKKENQALQAELKVLRKNATASEAKFRAIFDSTFQFIGLLSTDGTLLEANETALRFGGFTLQQAQGNKFWDAPWWSLSQETKDALKAAIRESAKGEFVRYDVDVVGGEGQVITIDFSLTPVKNELGQVISLIAEGRDISEAYQTKQKLLYQENLLSRVKGIAKMGSWVFDPTNSTFIASDNFYNILELDPAEYDETQLIDKIMQLVHPKDLAMVQDLLEKSIKGTLGSTTFIFRCYAENGELKYLQTGTFEIDSDRTNPKRLGGFAQDISELKIKEEQLSASEERFRKVFDNQGVAIALVNQEGELAMPNQTFADLLGYSLDELTMMNFKEFTYPDDLEKDIKLYLQVLNNERDSYQIEKRYFKKDGEVIWVDLNVSSVRNEEGRLLYGLAIVQNIDRRKKAEEELKNINQSLEEKVRQRTLQLERSNKELEQFAYVASHDLQEPLRKITSFTDMILKNKANSFDEQTRQYFDRVVGSAKRMRNLINDLLDYSRIMRDEPQPQAINLGKVVTEVMADMEVAIAEADARVDANCNDVPLVLASDLHIKQILQNLLSNAIKYRKQAVAPQVHIGCEVEGDMVKLYCADNGIGFDTKYLDRIFKPFQRLHGKLEYSGTGIGLAICERIVNNYGGSITAESSVGEGSTFIVSLKRADA